MLVRSVSILASLVLLAAGAGAQVHYLKATINSAQEVPPNGSTATGFGSFRLDTTANTITWHVEFSGLSSTETASHIHGFAPPGTNAGVLINLGTGSPKTGSAAITDAQEASFLAGLAYVNIHSGNFPGGEIRGQMLLGPTEYYLTTTLSGLNEVPPNPSPGTGIGCFVLTTATGALDFHVEYSGLTSPETASHIHGFATAGQNAGVLIGLPLGTPKDGTANVALGNIERFANGLTYVNVHTQNFAGGEIRGQLVQAPAHVPICFGDAGCPCGNNSAPGQGGCLNSVGQSAVLAASGFASLACDTLTLNGSQMFTSTAIYIQGNVEVAPTVFGDGLRCFGGTLRRLAVVANSAGASQCPPAGQTISTLGLVGAPGTFVYGVYYRDPDLGFCPGQTFNTANSVRVVWVP